MSAKKDDFSALSSLPDVALIDFDDTLYSYAPCHAAALATTVELGAKSLEVSDVEWAEAYADARRGVKARLSGTAASHNRLLYFQGILDRFGATHRPDFALRLYHLYWDTFVATMELHPGVPEFLAALGDAKVKRVFLSDLTADVQFKKLAAVGLGDCFDTIVTSEEAGAEKPDRAIYDYALTKCGGGNSFWAIGDSPHRDIAGGQAIGAVTLLKANGVDVDEAADRTADCVFDDFVALTEHIRECAG